jgi:DNA-binding transcriptional LysR family regulator
MITITISYERARLAMDINKYSYIMMVAQTRNITRAAQRLHISQPALTKAIRKMEEETGLPLFERDKKNPIRLTYAGERYLEEAKKILQIHRSLEEELREIAAGVKGKIEMGIPVETAATWLPHILPPFLERYPDVEIQIHEGNSASFERSMLKGTLDFCIYTLPVRSPELDYDIVNENPIFLVSSPRHLFARDIDLAANGPADPHYLVPQRLNGEKLLTLTSSQGMYRIAMQILERHNVQVKIALQLTSNYTISSLAAAGLGLAFTTQKAGMRMKNSPNLHPVFYTLDDPVFTRKMIIAYRKGNDLSPAAQKFVELAKVKLQDLTASTVVVHH